MKSEFPWPPFLVLDNFSPEIADFDVSELILFYTVNYLLCKYQLYSKLHTPNAQ